MRPQQPRPRFLARRSSSRTQPAPLLLQDDSLAAAILAKQQARRPPQAQAQAQESLAEERRAARRCAVVKLLCSFGASLQAPWGDDAAASYSFYNPSRRTSSEAAAQLLCRAVSGGVLPLLAGGTRSAIEHAVRACNYGGTAVRQQRPSFLPAAARFAAQTPLLHARPP